MLSSDAFGLGGIFDSIRVVSAGPTRMRCSVLSRFMSMRRFLWSSGVISVIVRRLLPLVRLRCLLGPYFLMRILVRPMRPVTNSKASMALRKRENSIV